MSSYHLQRVMIFPEYVFPMLSMLPDDPEKSVRICYSSNIAKLTLTAYGFSIHSIRLCKEDNLDELRSPQKVLINTDVKNVQLVQLKISIAEVVQELVMDPKQTLNI
ncbi:unnamed protein product [Lupinus luteus]|uniref:Phosphatase 2A Regulatory Subunit A helical domain-containing protein n=1 Tax=Lupinus luteus TaxID=3873 RepID=A0AAV1WUE3_LUPLU